MTNDAERVSDIVPAAWRVYDASQQSWHFTTVEPPAPALSSLSLVEPLYTADIIEAQSKALAEARMVLSDVNDLLNYIDDHGHMLKREWTPELRERVWSFADRIPPLLIPTPENPNG